MPIAPSSLTMTAVSRSHSARRSRLRSVVLPLPRKPVRTKTGRRPSAPSVSRRAAVSRTSDPSPPAGGGALIRSLAGAKSGSRANRSSRSNSRTEATGSPSSVQRAGGPSRPCRRWTCRVRVPAETTAPSPAGSARASTFHWANDASRSSARSGDRIFVPSGMGAFLRGAGQGGVQAVQDTASRPGRRNSASTPWAAGTAWVREPQGANLGGGQAAHALSVVRRQGKDGRPRIAGARRIESWFA